MEGNLKIMDKKGIISRREACYFLGIREDATEEQIKKAYRYKAKLYHPDANPDKDTREYYIKAQEAYEYLLHNPYIAVPQTIQYQNTGVNMPFYYTNVQPQRPAKIFSSSDMTRAQYQKQKIKEKEHEKMQKWDADYRSGKRKQKQEQMYGKEYAQRMMGSVKSKEEEVLEKIRAIWLAETIKRQIAQDEEQREVRQRRKLYQAFMQQNINVQEDKMRRQSWNRDQKR